jgi:hypothetical protein
VQARKASADVQEHLHSVFGTRCRRSPLHIPAVLRLDKEQQPGWAPGPVWTPATDRITIPRSGSLVTTLDPVRYVAYNKYILFAVVYVTVLDSVCRFPLRFAFCAEIIIIIIRLSWSWATCWPVPISRIQKSRQRSAMIPSASWGIAYAKMLPAITVPLVLRR